MENKTIELPEEFINHKADVIEFVEILCCSVHDPTDPQRYWKIYKDICKIIVDYNPKNPPVAEGKLREAYVKICGLRQDNFESYKAFEDLLKRHNCIGYNYICKMAIGFQPEQLIKK